VLSIGSIRNAELQRLSEVRIPYGTIPTGTGFSAHDKVCLLQTRNELSVKANPTPASVPVEHERPRHFLFGTAKWVVPSLLRRSEGQFFDLEFRSYALDVCKVRFGQPNPFVLHRHPVSLEQDVLRQVYQCPNETGFPLKA